MTAEKWMGTGSLGILFQDRTGIDDDESSEEGMYVSKEKITINDANPLITLSFDDFEELVE